MLRLAFKLGFPFCCVILQFNICVAQQLKLIVPIGHTEGIAAQAISPDGKYLVTGSTDKSVKIWEINTGKLLNTLTPNTERIISVSFSPDGKKILTANRSSEIRMWDFYSGKMIFDLRGHSSEVSSARFSQDGKKVVSGSIDQTAKIWDAETGILIKTLAGHHSYVSDVNFSHNGKYIVTASWDKSAIIWDANTGEPLFTIKGHTAAINFCYFSPDDKYIITTSKDATAKVWSTENGRLVNTLHHTAEVYKAVFFNESKSVLTTSKDKTAKGWDVLTGKLLYTLNGHTNEVFAADITSDDKFIVTGSDDATARIWNAHDGKLIKILKGHTSSISEVNFTPGNEKIITGGDKTARVWRTSTGELVQILQGHTKNSYEMNLSPDEKKLLIGCSDLTTKVWDPLQGKFIKSLPTSTLSGYEYNPASDYFLSFGASTVMNKYLNQFISNIDIWDLNNYKIKNTLSLPPFGIENGIVSPDGKYIAAISMDYEKMNSYLVWWSASTGKLVKSILTGHTGVIWDIKFLPQSDKLITISWDGTSKIWDLQNSKLLFTLKGHTDKIQGLAINPNGKVVATYSIDSTIKIWDVATGDLLSTLPQQGIALALEFSKNGNYLLAADNLTGSVWSWKDNKVKMLVEATREIYCSILSHSGNTLIIGYYTGDIEVWDIASGKLIHSLMGHTDKIYHIQTDSTDKFLYSLGADDRVIYWDIQSGKPLCTFVTIDSTDYLSYTPSGYYQSSTAAAKLLYYVNDKLQTISFEQLDVKYNRPDKVLEALGNTDTVLIKSYRRAWEKRIKKLGIDTTAFRDGYSIPSADFTNRDAIQEEQTTETLKLIIKGNDSIYKLDRFNVWVNETPVFGQRGISIRNSNKNNFDTTLTIKLSQGENRIETSVINVNGTESYRMPLTVNYSPAVKQKEMTRFIGIGIDQFADSKYNLQYSSKDIRDLSKKLKEKYKDNIIIDTLFNENVSVATVKAIKEKLLQTTENDKVIIAYSGHGMLSKDFDYYLSTYNINFEQPGQNGLSYDELENLLDSIPARKKLLLIDACHSGEVDKEDLITLNATPDSLIKGLKPVAYKRDGQLGLKNSFELMQSLFVNVGKSTGATIISAAAGTQFALERNDLKNGVFTYSILEAMNKYPSLKISELKKIVGERVEQLTKGLQKPTSRNETIAVDWNVW